MILKGLKIQVDNLYRLGLSSIERHVGDRGNAIIISAFKDELTFKENMERHKKLIGVRKDYYRFIEYLGHYNEIVENHNVDKIEVPIFKFFICIPYFESSKQTLQEFFDFGNTMQTQYDQESCLFIENGRAKIVKFCQKTGDSNIDDIGNFNADSLRQMIFPRIFDVNPNEREIIFEEGLYLLSPSNYIHAISIKARNDYILESRGWNSEEVLGEYLRILPLQVK